MKKWIEDNRLTEEFIQELANKKLIDVDGYRYIEDEILGRKVVRRISLDKMREINAVGQVTIFDFDFVEPGKNHDNIEF